MKQHDSKTFVCWFEDSSNNVMPLSGYTPTFYLQSVVIGSPVILTKIGTVPDPSAGIIVFNIIPSDSSIESGDYNYEISIDNSTNRYTLADRFNFEQAIPK